MISSCSMLVNASTRSGVQFFRLAFSFSSGQYRSAPPEGFFPSFPHLGASPQFEQDFPLVPNSFRGLLRFRLRPRIAPPLPPFLLSLLLLLFRLPLGSPPFFPVARGSQPLFAPYTEEPSLPGRSFRVCHSSAGLLRVLSTLFPFPLRQSGTSFSLKTWVWEMDEICVCFPAISCYNVFPVAIRFSLAFFLSTARSLVGPDSML